MDDQSDQKTIEIDEKNPGDVEIEIISKKSKPEKAPEGKAALKANLKSQEKEIETLEGEIEKIRNEYFRAVADKENQRKRLEREKSDYYQYALTDVFKDFLDILDNFERAMECPPDTEDRGLLEGVKMIYRQLLEMLKRHGVVEIQIEGNQFDPTVHQAFSSEEHEDVSEPTVAEVLQKGYKLNDRLLRPALVKVNLPKKSQGKEE